MINSNIMNWLFRRLNRRKLLIKKITRRIISTNDLFRRNQLYLPLYIVTTQDVSSFEFFRNYTELAMLVRKAYIEESNNVLSNEDYLHPVLNLGSLFLAELTEIFEVIGQALLIESKIELVHKQKKS